MPAPISARRPTTSRLAPASFASRATLLLLVTACAGAPSERAAADSLELERTRCYGSCPAYSVTVARNGAVRFETVSGDDGRVTIVAADRAPGALSGLAAQAERAGFYAFPDVIAADRVLCPDSATDHPTVTVTIHRSEGTKRVADYRGCAALASDSLTRALAALRAFEDSVDVAVNTARWVAPPTRR